MNNISFLSIAFTYVGTIVGAGFASGQEIKSYFADFGVYGIIGLCIASFLIYFLGKKIMILCNKNNIDTYEGLLKQLSNNRLVKGFDFLITIFLIGTVTTMCSGMGSLLNQVFNTPIWVGSLGLMIVSIFAVKKGILGISRLNIFIVPILIGVTIIISISAFSSGNITFPQDINIVRSLFAPILYVSYNVIMSISVLPAMAVSTNKQEIERGGRWAGIIICVLGMLMSFALFFNYDIIQDVEIPLAVLSNRYVGFYIIMFLLEVFSTAVSSLYGVYGRLNKNNKILCIVVVFAYLFSLLGFSNLVTYLYSVMGVIGIFMIIIILNKDECK